ncbi:hypothetical protein [Stetteria hydrogenophila]
MQELSLAYSFIETVKRLYYEILSNELLSRLVLATASLIAFTLFLYAYRGVLRKMVEAGRLSEEASARLYKIMEPVVIVLILITIAYLLTQSRSIIAFTAGVALLVLAASWQVMANFIYYYIVLFMGYPKKGDLIIMSDGRAGRIEDLRPMGLVLSGVGPARRWYFIPYRELFSQGFTIAGDVCIVRVRVTVEGVTPDMLDAVRDIIERRALEVRSQISVAPQAERALRLYLEEITGNSATFVVTFVTTQMVGREYRLVPILHLLALALREAGYTKFRVSLERPEWPGR